MSDGQNALARIGFAKQALAEARDFTEILKIRDQAVAAEAYATARGADEAAQMAVEIKLRAERKAGQFIADMKEADLLSKGGRPSETGNNVLPVNPTLKELGVAKIESYRWQKIAAIPEPEFEERLASEKKKTQSMLLDDKAHVGHATGEEEWYTPQDIIKAARLTMGSIDVDPASCEAANQVVKAATFYSKTEDGLTKNWPGNVWLNPPYSQPDVTDFCDLLVTKYKTGEVTQACVLVNNATETGFYQNMLNSCAAVCLIKGRVRFIDRNGNPGGAPLQGQTIIYFGYRLFEFAENFQNFGGVLFAE